MEEIGSITITIPATEAAVRHIEQLQSIITKRNGEIARLTARLEEAETGEPNQKALAAAYKRGWREAAEHLMTSTATAARALGSIRKDAWAIYLQSEKGGI